MCLAAAALWMEAATAQTVAIATLPPGALNNAQANTIAKVVQQNTDLQMRVSPMQGIVLQLSAVDAGDAEFSVTDATLAVAAVTGREAFKGRAKRNLRVAFTAMAFPVGIFVRKDSPITSLRDLKGRRYPTGWQAFPNGRILSAATLASVGLTLADVDPVPVPDLIRAANDFKSGKTDATIFAVGAPKVAEVNAAVGGIRFLSVDDSPEAIARMKRIRPDFYVSTVRPAPPFAGIVAATRLLTFDLIVAVGAHVPDDVVYKLVKAVHANKQALIKGHPSFRRFVPGRMAKQYSAIDYHPGAVRFYKEIGIWPGT